MPITKIHYSKSAEAVNNIGLRSWKKFGAEWDLVEGEIMEQAVKGLKEFVNDNIKQQMIPTPEPSVQVSKPTKTLADLKIEQINACETLEQLENPHIKKYANSSDEKIKTAYQNKLQNLQK